MTEQDVPQALELSGGAGWNQTSQDWRLLLQLDPDSCFAIECDGRLAATTTLTCYGQRLAWLGMVLTRPEYRRRGFARLLVTRALEFASAKSIRTVKLDATDQAMELYESLGFRAEQRTERWAGPGAAGQFIPGVDGSNLEGALALDREVFGSERERLLVQLAAHAGPITRNGAYLFHRPGTRAAYMGPCSARTPELALECISSCLTRHEGLWFWDLLPQNEPAVLLAKRFGFQKQRRLVRMYRGQELPANTSSTYAIAGFEFG